MSVLEQTVPEGYKKTEVGVIPKEWGAKDLGEVCSLKSGLGITAKDIDINSNFPCYGGNGLRGYTKTFTHEGDYALIGRQGALCGNVQFANGKFFASEHALVATPNKDNDAKWLSIYLERMNLNQYSESSAQPGLSAEKLKVLKLITPLPKEQTAIANALSDVDALLTELKKLIAKKQAIKTATMQQLLTGKTRLPQFATYSEGEKQGQPKGITPSELCEIPEDWHHFIIDKNATLKARIGWQALTTKEYLDSGNKYLVTGTDFDAGEVNWSSCCYVSDWRYKQDSNIKLKENDVLITKDGTIGKVGFIKKLPLPATLNSGVFVIRPKGNSFLPKYLFYILTSSIFKKFIKGITAGSTITHLYQKDFVHFGFYGPKIEEQTAIATILSDMDNEIQALEKRLTKTRQIKQGMMQQLLTGRTRLPF
jgi:type I restriction enzyme S subunit